MNLQGIKRDVVQGKHMQVGDCVQISDGRIGRVRDVTKDRVRVRVMRTTSHTHQFSWHQQSEVKVVTCPAGWMSPSGYNSYLKITLEKMKERNEEKGSENEDKITLSDWNKLPEEEKEILRTWAIKHGYELDLVPGGSGSFDPLCDYAALLTYDQMVVYLRDHNQKIPDSNKAGKDYEVLWENIIKLLEQKNC